MKNVINVLLILCVTSLLATLADNEVKVTAMLRVDNGNFSLQRAVQNYAVNQTGKSSDYGIQTITTSTNLLNIYNVTGQPHYAFFRNLHTNQNIYVTFTMLLLSNDVAVVPVATTNISAYVTGTNGNAQLEYWINAN